MPGMMRYLGFLRTSSSVPVRVHAKCVREIASTVRLCKLGLQDLGHPSPSFCQAEPRLPCILILLVHL